MVARGKRTDLGTAELDFLGHAEHRQVATNVVEFGSHDLDGSEETSRSLVIAVAMPS